MMMFTSTVLAMALLPGLTSSGRAADANDANATVDKAIKALGGQEKLSKIKAASWKSKGTISLMGNDNMFTTQSTVQGLDHINREFEGDFGGNRVKGLTVLAGDKGWRKFGENPMDLDSNGVANEKRTLYLTVVPLLVLPLKGKEFKLEAIGDENIDGKPAAGIKATGPDGKDFKLYFDKQTGLPVKLVARVAGFMGDEYTQETTFGDYK